MTRLPVWTCSSLTTPLVSEKRSAHSLRLPQSCSAASYVECVFLNRWQGCRCCCWCSRRSCTSWTRQGQGQGWPSQGQGRPMNQIAAVLLIWLQSYCSRAATSTFLNCFFRIPFTADFLPSVARKADASLLWRGAASLPMRFTVSFAALAKYCIQANAKNTTTATCKVRGKQVGSLLYAHEMLQQQFQLPRRRHANWGRRSRSR